MIIINKPEELNEVQCYKCKTIIKVHPLNNMNNEYFTDCALHNTCNHESDGYYYKVGESMVTYSPCLERPITFYNAQYKCKKCGVYYR